jgi:hypothetical protein
MPKSAEERCSCRPWLPPVIHLELRSMSSERERPQMRRPKKRRFSESRRFYLLYQILRYCIDRRMPLFRVAEVWDQLAVSPETQSPVVALEILGLPFTQGGRVKGSLSARKVAKFFGDWKIQAEFIKWYAKQIASNIPANTSLMGMKGKLESLTRGRAVKLPPQDYLIGEYSKLKFKIGLLQARFGKHLTPRLTRERYGEILKFGADSGATWAEFVKKRKIYLEELLDAPPGTVAKLILSKQYGCKEASVHDRLVRKSYQW